MVQALGILKEKKRAMDKLMNEKSTVACRLREKIVNKAENVSWEILVVELDY